MVSNTRIRNCNIGVLATSRLAVAQLSTSAVVVPFSLAMVLATDTSTSYIASYRQNYTIVYGF